MTESGKRRRFIPDTFKREARAAIQGGRPEATLTEAELLPKFSIVSWPRRVCPGGPSEAQPPARGGRRPEETS